MPCINHKDENKQNNEVDNLEWCTIAYNNNYGSRHISCGNGKRIKIKNVDTNKIYNSLTDAQNDTGIHKQSISYCINKKQHTAGGYRWEVV